MYLGVELPGHRGSLPFNLLKTSRTTFQRSRTISRSHQQCQGLLVLTNACYCLGFFFFLILAIWVGVTAISVLIWGHRQYIDTVCLLPVFPPDCKLLKDKSCILKSLVSGLQCVLCC